MFWLYIATGFTGGMTFLFVCRWTQNWLFPPPVVDVHFSPKGGCAERVVREIANARKEILVLAYSFTSKIIVDALIGAHNRGVNVEIVLDHSNEKEEHTDLPIVLDAGIRTFVDPHHAIAHNKVMIIDRKTVLTGSFNFTSQAENQNAENLLVLHLHHDLITLYRQNYELHRSHARAPEKHAEARDERRRAA